MWGWEWMPWGHTNAEVWECRDVGLQGLRGHRDGVMQGCNGDT